MREIREILFRGKCCTTGEWVEGFLGIEVLDDYVIQQFSFDEYFASECIDQYSVKLETVGQYTGLTDKNGTRIFEGDVIRDEDGDVMVVKWLTESAAFVLEPKPYASIYFYGTLSSRIEVIGNIHDNPELLKGSAKNE